ncbi:uncharacterized protein LOC117315694 [Pecten maximus]|uniref:uncharacterized protein LOC117315694 n=1 Tax=Pecten maximus TaxID=6579 RepID=UPI001457F0ED|nr:uncharacterized protein LOC117315694 [Pecten maximus]
MKTIDVALVKLSLGNKKYDQDNQKIRMKLLSLRPSEIRYSQDSIARTFRHGRHSGIAIGQTLDDLVGNNCTVHDIPTITVTLRDGLWYCGDNRRLWVFRKCEELGIIERVPAVEGSLEPYKFTTDNFGVSIHVRGDPGGQIWTQRHREVLAISDQTTWVIDKDLSTVSNSTDSDDDEVKVKEPETIDKLLTSLWMFGLCCCEFIVVIFLLIFVFNFFTG